MSNNNENQLENIYDICSKLYSNMCGNKRTDHCILFSYLTELGKSLVNADRASFWKWDTYKHELWTTSATGTDKIVIPENTGLVGKALKEQRVVITNDPYSDPDFNSAVDKKTGYVTKSILVMPIADVNGDFIGALQVINKPGGFDEERDTRCLSLAAIVCGLTLESDTFLENSQHDKLTRLKNRLGFQNDYVRIYSKLLEQGRPLSMFICDIDKFKRVNDTYGHNAGDAVLSFNANILAEACEEGQGVYRWGGEEFIMMMPDTTLDKCVEKAETIRKRIMESPCDIGTEIINYTVSFGCRQFDPVLSVVDNINAADEHLYTAKAQGRNRVIF